MVITLAQVLSTKEIKGEKCTFFSVECVTSTGFLFKVTTFEPFSVNDFVSVLLDTDSYGQARVRIVPKVQF